MDAVELSDKRKEGKVSEAQNDLTRETRLLTYVVNQLIEQVKMLREEIRKAKVIQVPYPVMPPTMVRPQMPPQRPVITNAPPYSIT